MLGSAAATTYLTSALPTSAKFLGVFIGQISTIGIYILGAPIWEQVSSRIRKYAFNVGEEPSRLRGIPDSNLEKIWLRTQSTYTQNAQYSRNLMNQFLFGLKQNFDQGLRGIGHHDGEVDRALLIDQVAEALMRARRLSADLPFDDTSIVLVVRMSLLERIAYQLELRKNLSQLLLERLREVDPDSSDDHVMHFYSEILRVWKISEEE